MAEPANNWFARHRDNSAPSGGQRATAGQVAREAHSEAAAAFAAQLSPLPQPQQSCTRVHAGSAQCATGSPYSTACRKQLYKPLVTITSAENSGQVIELEGRKRTRTKTKTKTRKRKRFVGAQLQPFQLQLTQS